MDKTRDTTKGRKRKQTSFNFTPRKLDINDTTQTIVTKSFISETLYASCKAKDSSKNRDIDEGSSIDFTPLNYYTIPIGLQNLGVNVSFFNSVIQILCFLPEFWAYIQNNFHKNDDIAIINTLVHDIFCANQPVNTYDHVVRLNIPNYQHGTQFDAHECLIHLLDRCYPTLSDIPLLLLDRCYPNMPQHV